MGDWWRARGRRPGAWGRPHGAPWRGHPDRLGAHPAGLAPPGTNGAPGAHRGHNAGSRPGAAPAGPAPGAPGAWLEARLAQGPLSSPLLARWPELARLSGRSHAPGGRLCVEGRYTPGAPAGATQYPGFRPWGHYPQERKGAPRATHLLMVCLGLRRELWRLAPVGREVEGMVRLNAAAATCPLSLLCGHQLLLWLLEAYGGGGAADRGRTGGSRSSWARCCTRCSSSRRRERPSCSQTPWVYRASSSQAAGVPPAIPWLPVRILCQRLGALQSAEHEP